MLSRLSGFANTVLHELSRDDSDVTANLDPESPAVYDVGLNNSSQEDIFERLSYSEQLILELREIIRQKDSQLQQKDDVLQEERRAADIKIKKVKLRAKAKVNALNKHIEEIKAQGEAVLATEPQSEESLSEHDKTSPEGENEIENIKYERQEKEKLISNLQAQLIEAQSEQANQFAERSAVMEEFVKMKEQLHEKEAVISTLQEQLSQTQAEQAAQFAERSAVMEEFVKMKEQLHEKEAVISTLQEQLSQTQAEQAAQLSSMQQVVREKDARFETQVRLHEDELLQLVTQADVETEMQQKLRMQRKLEEYEQALLGRGQVVNFLQQELTAAEQKNQSLSQQLQEMQAEHSILKNSMELERQETKIRIESMELELAERKLTFHSLQAEMQHVMGQLEQAGLAQSELELRYTALEQKHKEEIEEKAAYILNLQKNEQELQSVCESLKEENAKLVQDKNEEAVQFAKAVQQLEDQLQEKSEEINQLLNKPTLENHETASQTSFPVADERAQAVTEENIASLQKRGVELENEKEALLLSAIELKELKTENENLSSQITLRKAQNRTEEADGEVGEISMVDVPLLKNSSSSTEENGHDVLENTFSQKHKELSVLLLELKEAQEEVEFLKSQLQGKKAEGDHEVLDQKEMQQTEVEGMPPVGMEVFHEDTLQDVPLVPDEESSVLQVEKEEQAGSEHQNTTAEQICLNDTIMELKSSEQDDVDKSPSSMPDIGHCHQDEVERLKSQILELETNFHKAEETFEKNLDEKAQEISRLTHLIEEFKKNAEDTSSVLSALSEERDQLLFQVKELNVLAELRARIKLLETKIAETEKQRKLDYESQTAQHSVLTEQIHSLSIEAKSKDVKIEALQKELDVVQLQFSEQSTLIKSLQSQLQKKENEVLQGAERVRGISNKMEELSQALSLKEHEIAEKDQLLLEKKRDVETLQQTIQEKDQQVTEISFSMTEKIEQLNEEKFSLGIEIKTLKEQLNLLSRAEEAKKEQVEENKEVISGFKHNYDESSPAGLKSKEELQHELDCLKKESEQRKRKLQAALINRKELLQRISTLEEELARERDEPKKEILLSERERRQIEEDKSKEAPEKCMISEYQNIEISLKQTISEKEMELQHVKKDLEEKIAAKEELQNVVQQLNQNLQDKANQIDLLQAEIIVNQTVIQNLTTGAKDAGDGDSASPVKETVVSSPPAADAECWKPKLEEKIMNLEKEKEQLQNKLQENLKLRKAILKKARENERCFREELKQQKDDYNHLQEQFNEQRKENKNIEDLLGQLQVQVREYRDRTLPGTHQQEPDSPDPSSEEPLFKAIEHHLTQPTLESDMCPDSPSHSVGINTLRSCTSIVQIKAHLKEIKAEREELELKAISTTNELTKKSEEISQLKEQINKKDLEIQSLTAASHEAEAHAESLKHKLECSQLEIVGLEHLRALQPKLDELQKLISQKEEEVSHLSGQLSKKEKTLTKVQTDITEQEDLIKALHTQLAMQAKEYEGRIEQLHMEICETKKKEEECKEAKHQISRKLQAALLYRKGALKEIKSLQEELSLARDDIEHLTKSLADLQSQVVTQNKEKDTLLGRLTLLQEERDKLIKEMDRSLLENQNLGGSCESLKLALEGLTEDKESLTKAIESLRCSKIAENTEWQEKHSELQKEYEILLQSYENVSNEAERIQHVVQTVRQEKQELYGRLRSTEASKKETEKQLQEAEQEIVAMKERMRKFAKAKQQKIIELEEENEQLRGDAYPTGDTAKQCIESLLASNSNMKEELEKIKTDYKTLSKEYEALMAEKDILSEEVQNLKHQVKDNVSNQASVEATEKPEHQQAIFEGATQPVPGEVQGQDSPRGSTKPEDAEVFQSENSDKRDLSENISCHDEIHNLQQFDQLKERIAELEEEKKDEEYSQTLQNEKNADEVQGQDPLSVSTKPEDAEAALSENGAKPDLSEIISCPDEIHNLQQFDQLKERIAELEEEKKKNKELNQTLQNEKNDLLSQISTKDNELKILQEEAIKINLLNQQIQEELSRVTKLKQTAEEEKDDLEEKLMNQLAELNGSIGNYYQDVTDAHRKNELLESEMRNLKRCVSELEEEKEQLVKEKTKVEAEMRKEYLEKLQSAQKGQISKSHLKELQELLKEKQHEIKQLQTDCIRYQEKITALERTVKALEHVQTESQKDMELTKENLVQAVENRKRAQAELASLKVLLDDTQSEAARVLAENLKLKKELQLNKESVKSQMKQKDEDLERRLEQAEEKHLKKKKNMQEKLDTLYIEKVHLEEVLGEIQVTLNKKDNKVKQLQENLASTVAQLTAFTKSMSSLQDDRDRMIDEAKKWERKFGDAIRTKEEEIRLKEENCSVLKDQIKQMSSHMEELKSNISRLEHDKQIWESKAQTEVHYQQKVCDTLQGENKELLSQLEETRHLYYNSQNELNKLESEIKSLKDQSTDLNNSLEKCKENKETLEGIIKQQEADIQNCKVIYEQLETDLQASRELTGKLSEEINMKEKKIVSLLSGKEKAIEIAIAELHHQHDKEIKELENLLSQEEEENVVLEEKNKKAVDKTNELMETLKITAKENIQQKAQLDSFVKAMSSLQNDRDRIANDYQQLEKRHISIILEKDQLIQDAATENNKLKEEIRSLRNHMDDLNSENAKLDTELIQIREDLKQVITMKDCQQKQLLEAQLQENKGLKNECAKLEEKLKESQAAKEGLQKSADALHEEKQGLSKEIENLKVIVSQLNRQVTTLQEELKVKEEEVQRLSTMLSSSQKRVTKLEEELIYMQKESAKKVGEIEDKLKKELKHLHHDAGIMRNETETAEERVAELARDLVEMEQKLLAVTKENKDLIAQIQSFGKSMSSLQNSRDHANEELDELKRKYDASLKELAQLREQNDLLHEESNALSQTDCPVNTAGEKSLSHLEKLNQQLISKDEQLLHLSSQLDDSYNQVQSFSKAVTTLQNERDHLRKELEKFQKSEEGKQMGPAHPVSSSAEVQFLQKAMSSLQTDRDRLLKELKNLQQQCLQTDEEITELRPLKVQVQEHQDEIKKFQLMQEELRRENLSWQHELHQLRMEKSSWEMHDRKMKEQYLIAISDKDQQLSHLQNILREFTSSSQTQTKAQTQASPEASASLDGSQDQGYETELLRTQLNNSLKEIHQKELRIQNLNSNFSQLLEEKNTLSIQLCNTSQNLRENQHHYTKLFNHCAILEKQIQELKAVNKEEGLPDVSVAPGAPQENSDVQKKSDADRSFSKTQQQLCDTRQEVDKLRKLLEEEQDHRMAAENALSMAEEQIRRLEHKEWDSARTPIIDSCGNPNQSVTIDLTENSCRRTRSSAGWKRVLRSLCHSRTRVPLLATIYILLIHILLVLCFTGHL